MKKIILAAVLLLSTFAAEACPPCGLAAWVAYHQTAIIAVSVVAGTVSQVETMTINGIVLKEKVAAEIKPEK
jgi:hypothetical protein